MSQTEGQPRAREKAVVSKPRRGPPRNRTRLQAPERPPGKPPVCGAAFRPPPDTGAVGFWNHPRATITVIINSARIIGGFTGFKFDGGHYVYMVSLYVLHITY